MRSGFYAELRCPSCGGELTQLRMGAGVEGCALGCAACDRQFPVRGGVPRFVSTPADVLARRTQQSFAYEWTHFHDWRPSGEANFDQYFGGLDLKSLSTCRVLDAACGMGRHARLLARHVSHLVALDFSAAIDQAAINLASCENVDCVQADLRALPFSDGTFDFVYSFGVLHHLVDTEAAIRHLVSKVRPGGRVRIYVYWSRTGVSGALLSIVSAIRVLTVRTPHPILKALCWAFSAALFTLVVLPYRGLERVGVHLPPSLPLVAYVKYPFSVIWNDQFDRFATPLEKRFSEAEVTRLLESAGLRDVTVLARHGWVAEGVRAPC